MWGSLQKKGPPINHKINKKHDEKVEHGSIQFIIDFYDGL